MNYNVHSVCLTYYHLIMIVKYRRKVIDDSILERAKEIWEYIVSLRKGGEKVLNIVYHFRIYPTEKTENLAGKTFGCCRFLYNQMLNDKIQEYEKTKKMLKNTLGNV